MIRQLFLFIAVIIAIGTATAQSRMPQVKVADRSTTAEADTTGYEERPYFLLIDQSEKALAEQDYDSAALRLIEAMSVEPDNELNVALLTNLGLIYYYDNKDSLALQVLDRAIQRQPSLVAAREGRARVLVGMRRDREAYDEYGRILALDSLNTDVRYLRSMMAMYNGYLSTARADLDVLNSVVPLSRKTMLANATLASLTGNETEAISLFRKLIEIEPAPEYYARMAACQIAIDNLGEASETIGEALEKYPHDAELYYYRAILNKKRYLSDEAHKDAKRAIELGADPQRVRAIFDK